MSLTELNEPPDNADNMTINSDGGIEPAGTTPPKNPSQLSKEDLFEVLKRWFLTDAEFSAAWRIQAKNDFDFRVGEQWSDTDKALLNAQQRPHIVFNRVLTILKAVAGMEINGRHEIQFLPSNNAVTAPNELLSAASKWMAAGCDGEDEESEAFDNCATCGMGWCLSDDALVRLPNTHFATTRLYSGSVVQIGLENGKELTGTPNHPVLTNRGWKRLCDLHEGDYLVNSAFMERVKGLPVEQFDEVETRLKDKIDAFRTGRESLRFATAPDDFYADGAGSKVHVVYADRALLDKVRFAALRHQVKKPLLAGWNLLAQVSRLLFPDGLLDRAVHPTIGQSALNWIHAPFRKLLSLGMGAQLMPGFSQLPTHGLVGATQTIANFDGRQTIFEIEPSQLFNGDREFLGASSSRLSKGKSSLAQAPHDGSVRYSKLIADFFDWKPLLEIEVRKLFSGDVGSLRYLTKVKFRADRHVDDFAVHDVGTSLGFFVAGNVITSNTENRLSYEDDPSGLYVEESINPLEMYWDHSVRKKNLDGAGRLARAKEIPLRDAMQLFPGKNRAQLDAVWAIGGELDKTVKSIEQKRIRDTDSGGTGLDHYDDSTKVMIVEIQWFEREVFYVVADEETQTKLQISEEAYEHMKRNAKTLEDRLGSGIKVMPTAARMSRKVYKRAFLGSELLQSGDAPVKGRFSWACITGELDRNKGHWFGLIKTMRDPQMWANKWLSQTLHILNTTAKGGIVAEESAFVDQTEAEEKWAQPDTIVWAADGSIGGAHPKIMPKPGGGFTQGHVELMQFAISSIRDCTGINLELLGQKDINQPGILEAQRKQAGMTVLATLFDSLRRFRKQVGRIRLYYIQTYFSDGRLIRVVGPEGATSLPLIRDKTFGEYDVIVDDTPTSPNQKEANWAIIQPLLAIFKDQLMQNPKVFAEMLEYSPLPARLVEMIKSFVSEAVDDPQKQQEVATGKQLLIAKEMAAINKDQSIAEMNNAKAGATQATASYDLAMAQHMLASGEFDKLKNHLDTMKTAAEARKADAEARASEHKATTAHAKLIDALSGHQQAQHDQAIDRGTLANDTIATHAAAARDHAAAHRDRVGAVVDALQPVQSDEALNARPVKAKTNA